MKAKYILTTPRSRPPAIGSPGFYLRPSEEAFPRNFIAELRAQIRLLALPPACLRFRGCVRLVYRAARQVGVKITVRKRRGGSYLIWKQETNTVVTPTTPSDHV